MMDRNHPMHFVLIRDVSGHADVAHWQDGLDHLCRQLPLGWSRIQSDAGGAPHFQLGQCGSIPLTVFNAPAFDWNTAAAAQMARPFDTSNAPLMRATLIQGSEPAMGRVWLSRAATAALLEKADREKCSVHGALCAAFVIAYADGGGFPADHPVRVSSLIDVRRRLLASSEHFGLCISAMVVEDEPASPSFWDRARHFSSALAPIKTVEGLSGLVFGGEAAMAQVNCVTDAAVLAAQLFAAEILLSNLGVTTIPEIYGSLRLESVWGPSVALGFLPEQTIGAVTFVGRLHLLHTSYAPVAGLLARAVEQLAGNVEVHPEALLEMA